MSAKQPRKTSPSHDTPVAPRAELVPRYLGPAIITVVALIMLAWTWRGWPDPIVDFGRELYVPWQISKGAVLYSDIAYFNGPLSPHFNALVFKLLGPSVMSLVYSNLLWLTALIVMLYRLLVTVADRLAATTACLVFVTVFAFVQLVQVGNYNYVTPYSHEITHGLV